MSGEVVLWNTSYGDYTDKEPEPCGCDAFPDHGPHHQDGTRIREFIALPAAEFEAWRRVVEAARNVVGVIDADVGHCIDWQDQEVLRELASALDDLPSARKEGPK